MAALQTNSDRGGRKRVVVRRTQRLRRVYMILGAVVCLIAVAVYLGYRATHQEVRRPGETLPEITRKLALDLPEEAPLPNFVDVTAAAGLGDFVSFTGTRTSQLPEDMGAGAAWGDFDNDGDEDLFLVGAGGSLEIPQERWAESILFENLGNGRFERFGGFPETRIMGMGAAWGDADGDGLLDLAVTGYQALVLFLNTGERFVRDETFVDREGYWSGVSWGDFDNDRDLDLYVSGYVEYEEDASAGRQVSEHYGASVPYTLNPASFEPAPNLLLENDGSGGFEDVAVLWGVSNPEGRSLSALWKDFNDDGLLDLYVANDISDNALYLNLGETFEDASLAAWVADYRGAMGLTTGDWNRDGDDDLFVTHWMAQENALYDSRLADFREDREASGQEAQLAFSDLSAPLGLGQPALQSVGWGTEFVDLDADGWLDLVVANGSTIESKENSRLLKKQAAMLFWNQAGEAFHDLAPLNELFSTPTVSRGLATADFDQDGDQDLVIVELDGGVKLLANEMQAGNWVELRLRNTSASGEPDGEALGALVVVRAGGVEFRRSVGGSSYMSQSSRTVHVGLGEVTAIDSVEVRWHAGESETFPGVASGDAWELVEGSGKAQRIDRPVGPGSHGAEVGLGRRASRDVPLTDDEKEQLREFWRLQREGMNRVKLEGDCERAVVAFRAALEITPEHEDSLYYLGNCLVALDRPEEGLAELAKLRQVNPMSHRGHTQWGVVRSLHARSRADVEAAEAALTRALEVNQEETGSLLALGEVELLLGNDEAARERLEKACRTNPQAANGFFFRAYLAWKAGDSAEVDRLLAEVRRARGPEWKPAGAVAEGDTRHRMHIERTPLFSFAEAWDGESAHGEVFLELRRYIESERFDSEGPSSARKKPGSGDPGFGRSADSLRSLWDSGSAVS